MFILPFLIRSLIFASFLSSTSGMKEFDVLNPSSLLLISSLDIYKNFMSHSFKIFPPFFTYFPAIHCLYSVSLKKIKGGGWFITCSNNTSIFSSCYICFCFIEYINMYIQEVWYIISWIQSISLGTTCLNIFRLSFSFKLLVSSFMP